MSVRAGRSTYCTTTATSSDKGSAAEEVPESAAQKLFRIESERLELLQKEQEAEIKKQEKEMQELHEQHELEKKKMRMSSIWFV